MATKATRAHLFDISLGYDVEPGNTVTELQTVVFGASDTTVLNGGGDTNDLIIGVALNSIDPLNPDEAAFRVQVLHPGPIVPMKAAGTITRGQRVKTNAAGQVLAAGAIAAGGGNIETTIGFAVQSGVLNDEIGICLVFGSREVA